MARASFPTFAHPPLLLHSPALARVCSVGRKGAPEGTKSGSWYILSYWQRSHITKQKLCDKQWRRMPKVISRKPPAVWDRIPEVWKSHKIRSTSGSRTTAPGGVAAIYPQKLKSLKPHSYSSFGEKTAF